MIKRHLFGALAVAALTLGTAESAGAVTFLYNLEAPSLGAPTGGIYGTVDVTQSGGLYSFAIQLAPDFRFLKGVFTDQNEEKFASLVFELTPSGNVPIPVIFSASSAQHFTELPVDFDRPGNVDDPPYSNNPFGIMWDHAIGCTINCGVTRTWIDANPTSLSFTFADDSNYVLDYNTAPENYPGQNIYFASDVAYKNPATGAISIGTIGSSLISAVPEPSKWAMMICGFGMIGFAMRRRKTVAVTRTSAFA